MRRTRTKHSLSVDTVETLKSRRNGSLRKLAVSLGFPANYAGVLSDVLRNDPGCLSLDGENELRRALGLPLLAVAQPCPSCGAYHGSGVDCHGAPVAAVVILRPGEVVKTQGKQRKRKPYLRPCLSVDPARRIEQLSVMLAQARRELEECNGNPQGLSCDAHSAS